MRKISIVAGFAAYVLLAVPLVLCAGLAFAGNSTPATSPEGPMLDFAVKVALALLAAAVPVQLFLAGQLLGVLRAHGKRLGEHDVRLAGLEESKVYRRACEERCEQRQRDCPAHQAAMARAAAVALSAPPPPSAPAPSAKG